MHHPVYLDVQDAFYLGSLKGLRRIYQQTFEDAYSKMPITLADLLNDKALPFFTQNQLSILRIFTSRGTEYAGG